MTLNKNKLPEVGKEYRSRVHKKIMKVKGFTDEVHFSGNMTINCIDRKDFWDHFEEIPQEPKEELAISKKETTTSILELLSRIEKLELKCKYLNNSETSIESESDYEIIF